MRINQFNWWALLTTFLICGSIFMVVAGLYWLIDTGTWWGFGIAGFVLMFPIVATASSIAQEQRKTP